MISDAGNLDKIIKETVSAIEAGKRQVFDIAENSRLEYSRLKKEFEEVRQQATHLVDEVDALTVEEKKARTRLAEVSKNFIKYSEQDIKKAYES